MPPVPQRPVGNVPVPSSRGTVIGLANPSAVASSAITATAYLDILADRVGDIEARAVAANEARFFHSTVAGTEATWTDKWLQAQRDAPARPSGFAKEFQAGLLADIEAAAEGAPTANAAQQLRARLQSIASGYYRQAAAFEHAKLMKDDRRLIAEVGDSLGTVVARDPMAFDRAIAELRATALSATEVLPDEDIEEALRDQQDRLASIALDNIAVDSPEEALRLVESGAYDEYLEPESLTSFRESLTRKVEIERRRREAEARAAAARGRAAQARAERMVAPLMRDHLNSIAATGEGLQGDVRKQVLATLGSEARAEFESAEASALEEHVLRTEFAELPERDIVERLREEAPDPGAGFTEAAERYDRLARAAEAELKSREADPAAYVTRFDDVREMFSAAEDATEMAEDATEMADAATKIRDALEYRRQRQIDIGIADPRLLDKPTAQNHRDQIMTAEPAKQGNVIAALQEQYGDLWVDAWRDIVDAGVDDATQYLALAAGDPALSAQASTAISMPQSELAKGLPSGQPADIERRVADKLAAFGAALTRHDWTGERLRQLNPILDAAQRTALLGVRQGRSESDAVELATGAVTNNFVIGSSLTWYAPRRIGGQDVDVGRIESALDQAQTEERIRAFNPVPFGTADPAVEPDEVMRRTIRAAVDVGEWSTLPSGKGVQLVVPVAGTFLPLLDENGAPYTVMFEDAVKSRISIRAPRAGP